MIKNRIIYLLILAVSFWIMLMYEGVFMEGIFAAAVVLPVICIILKYIAIFFINVSWTADTIKAEWGRSLNVRAVLVNRFFLPVNRVTITFEAEDILGNKEEYKIVTNLMYHMERYCTVELCPNYSGPVLVRLKSIKINDILGLTKASKKVGSILTIMVFPKPCECIPVTVENNIRYKEESDEYSEIISGNDKSQIFDISQYQLGDSIKDIHWKLSSKTDELMVKRYSYPIEKQINVFIDYGKPSDKQITTAGVGRFFDSLFGFLNELEKNNDSITIYAYTGDEGKCIPINKEDILYMDINNSCYVDTVCQTFMKNVGAGGNILISSRITKNELSEYGNLSQYYINWDDLYSEKENTIKELFIQDTQIIGMYMDGLADEKKSLVLFGDELNINKDNEEVEAYTYILRMLLVLLGSITPMLILYDVLVLYKSTPLKVIIYSILAVAIMFASTFIKKRGIKALYMTGAIAAAVLLLGINNIINGTLNVISSLGNSMIYYSSTSYGLTMTKGEGVVEFVALLALVYGILLFAFTWNSISVLIHMVLTIPPIALCLAYGCVPSDFYTVMYVAYISGVLVYSITYKNIIKGEKRVLKKAFYESTINIGAILAYVVMMLSAAIMFINSIKGYNRPDALNSMKANVNTFVEDFSLEKATINKTGKGGLGNGELGKVDRVTYTGEAVLTVNVSGDLTFPLYLRGYIGSRYTGNSWEVISDEENNEIMEKMDGTGISLHDMYNIPYYITSEEKSGITEAGLGKVNSGKIIIKNMIVDDSVYYIPYGAFVSPDIVLEKDGVVLNNVYGTKIYSVYQMQGIDNLDEYIDEYIDEVTPYGMGGNNYFSKEIKYRNIAYEYYSNYDGDEAIEERLKNEMPWEYEIEGITYNLHEGPEEIGYEPYILAVSDYLSENYTYNLSPGKLNDGQDFIEKFMDERNGYCSHFATIATEMFRIYGIPARYVEGYYVKPQPVEMIEYYKNNQLTIEVQDDSAHAWTEIYVDGLGFIPVETTPGFAGISYTFEEETLEETSTGNNSNNSNNQNIGNEATTAPQKESSYEETKIISADKEKENNNEAEIPDIIKNKYIVAIIIAAIILTAILGRKSRHDRKNDEIIKQNDRAKEAFMWEEQLSKMTCSIRPVLKLQKGATREQLAEEIIEYIDERNTAEGFEKKQLEKMFSAFDKAVYSQEGIDREEMKVAADTASAILEKLYTTQPVIRKLFIKYIKCLYLK